MKNVFICDAVRTPIGRYAGALSGIRADDLGALPIHALIKRNPQLDLSAIDDVFYGCANQSGEDNRNVARMSLLLAGLPTIVPGVTLNRLCGSGMDAIGSAARAIACGEQSLCIAGGVESMSRAPMVLAKAESAFSRQTQFYDTTMGWRFINPKMKLAFGVDSMPETAETVAEQFKISRQDHDLSAYNCQLKTAKAPQTGVFDAEIIPVTISVNRKETSEFSKDEHPRSSTTLAGLAKLNTPFKNNGTVTAGNASGINDGAAAVLLASEQQLSTQHLTPLTRVVAMATSGVEPNVMGIGPIAATQKVLKLTGLTLQNMDVIELNEAFAAQSLAVLRTLKIDDNDSRVNPNGGAIALGHPLGMSGARLVMTAAYELKRRPQARYALCTMCIGVGQGIAMVIEKA